MAEKHPPNEGDNGGRHPLSSEGPSSLVGLFSPPTPPPSSDDRKQTEHTPLLPGSSSPRRLRHDDRTPKVGSSKKCMLNRASELPSIREIRVELYDPPAVPLRSTVEWVKTNVSQWSHTVASECSDPSTWIGSIMFALFQVVFSLTLGATILRPHGTTSMLGLFAKMAAIGIMTGAPVYWINLRDVPALYPTVDLFPAPFLANIALIIDEELYQQAYSDEVDTDSVFLATFTFMASVSLFISGTLLVLSSVFRLANLGAYLPFPVLCGFFSAVGVMTWALAFKIDSNGVSIGQAVNGDWNLIVNSFLHHLPTVCIAACMKYLGPKNPFYIFVLVMSTIVMFYIAMFVFGVSIEEMRENHWFWSKEEIVYRPEVLIDCNRWQSPVPFGWINGMFRGKICWPAVLTGLDTTMALSFLYLIRCSLHGAALKKNVPMLSRQETVAASDHRRVSSISLPKPPTNGNSRGHYRAFSEIVDLENILSETANLQSAEKVSVVTAKPTNTSLKDILMQYGLSQFVCGVVGSFAVTPCVAASPTMFTLRAERVAPQIGSVVLLSAFYLSNFQLVSYIPKPAFSSLLVLAFIDIISTWAIKSWWLIKEKMEWLVVPTIVLLAFVAGLLQAVFLGIAFSTFLFVAALFRSGVVKYLATGLSIRSTIERPPNVARWLDENADQIQILVLQNYLFFGNASSILSYLTSMFEESDGMVDPSLVCPLPKIVIIDLSLVSGLDTSAVGAFADMKSICAIHDCKIFLSGVSVSIRETMRLSGVEPEKTANRSQRRLRFFPDLDSAIGKAEDLLIELGHVEDTSIFHRSTTVGDGFRLALRQIDEQHVTTYASELAALSGYTKPLEIEPGCTLYDDLGIEERGIFFIESGVLKIERHSDNTLSRNSFGFGQFGTQRSVGALGSLRARDIDLSKPKNLMSGSGTRFRLARVGPGWIIGSLEALGGVACPSDAVAVTRCRLHYISYKQIEEIEVNDTAIVLKLYKLLSFLMAKRQETTISQLGTLHSIMSSPARKKPMSRSNSASTSLNRVQSFENQ